MQHSPDEILEMARREVSARHEQERTTKLHRDLPWRYAFIGLAGALLLGLLAWPGAALNWKMYAVVHGVCAQIHNVEVGGLQLPICARNTGIYSSFLVTFLMLFAIGRGRAAKLPPIPITVTLVLFILAMAADGFNSMLRDMLLPHLYTPQNWLRTLTGTGMGVAVAVLLLMVLNVSLRKDADHATPVMRSWLELAGALALNLLVMAAMYGNISFMYWPIAASAWLGITGVLFLVNLLVSALAMGYDSKIERLAQLARPGTLALVLTLVELGLMSSIRFYFEGRGLM
ncbi:DUF2085 domain-containing protein [Chloroflexia bacterium SDU3-3]|nr:DUF2085 domain-containing protein [Chloroflexia bacterium SDU3-3]